jgi:hypothetical protein
LERIASELELAERPIVDKNQVFMQSQNWNIAIISRNALNFAVLLNKLPQSKLLEYDKYPLAFRVGFIHSLPEKDLI